MKTFSSFTSALAAVLLLASCAEIEPTPFGGDIKHETKGQKIEGNKSLNLGNQVSRALSYAPLPKLQQAVADRETEFSFNFFKAVAKDDINNISVSPFSLFTDLSMLANGTTGETCNEIVSALGLKDFTQEQVAAYYKSISDDLKELDNNVVFESVNSLWYDQEKAHPVSNYVSLIGDRYGAGTYKLDNRTLNPSEPVNSWAKEKSRGMVPTIVDKTKQYMWLLANVTFFQGAWTSDKYVKEMKTFTDITGKASEMNFFGQVGGQEIKSFNVGYADADLPSVIWLPYGNGAFSMAVVLPPAGMKLDEFVSKMTADDFARYSASADKAEKVDFRIPVFENTFNFPKAKIESALNTLGISRMFKSHGEFSGMFEDEGIYVDNMLMSSRITVNEKGTVAAAASVIGQGFMADLPRVFTADRPFVYAIVDIHNTILFMGTVTK